MNEQAIFFDSDQCRPPHPGLLFIRNVQDVERLVSLRPSAKAVWLAHEPDVLSGLLASMVISRPALSPLVGDHRLVLTTRMKGALRPVLQAVFQVVLAPSDEVRILGMEDLMMVLGSKNRADRLVGGAVDVQDKVLVLYRGNLKPLTVPLSWFRPSGDGTRPDPSDFEVTDWGNTVRLGSYEASADSILYDFDPAYRRRAKKNLVKNDTSFGGALRRLRLSRGLAQNAFEPEVSAKELARIEKGEVKKPRKTTLTHLGYKLGVAPEEIETF